VIDVSVYRGCRGQDVEKKGQGAKASAGQTRHLSKKHMRENYVYVLESVFASFYNDRPKMEILRFGRALKAAGLTICLQGGWCSQEWRT
jgi:hypothetical protein